VCYTVEQFTHLAIWGSIAFWFLFLIVYPHFWPTIDMAPEMVGMVSIALLYLMWYTNASCLIRVVCSQC